MQVLTAVRNVVLGAICVLSAQAMAASADAATKTHGGTQDTSTYLCNAFGTPLIQFANVVSGFWYYEDGDRPRVGEVFYVGGQINDLSASICARGSQVLPEVVLPAGVVPAIDAEHPVQCVKLDTDGKRVELSTSCGWTVIGPYEGDIKLGAVPTAARDSPYWVLLPSTARGFFVPVVSSRPLTGGTPTGAPCTRASFEAPPCDPATQKDTFQFVASIIHSDPIASGYLISHVGMDVSGEKRKGAAPLADNELKVPSTQRPTTRKDLVVPRSIRLPVARKGGISVSIRLPPGATGRVRLIAPSGSGLPSTLARTVAKGKSMSTSVTGEVVTVVDGTLTTPTLRLSRPVVTRLRRAVVQRPVRLSVRVDVKLLDGRTRTITKPIIVRR